jgi:ferredoxin-NADP reductase
MTAPWRTGIVKNISDETPTTKRFWIEVPELTSFDFKPGQFVTLDLPIHERKNKRWRSYSIASAPDGTNTFELVIVKLPEGAGTTYLFEQVTIGTEILLRGPQGVFTLPETLDKDLFLICTGTGIAPFRSMVNYIEQQAIAHQNIYLLFGCRKIEDVLYYTELNALQERLSNFHYIPVFSRESAENTAIKTGYIHQQYENILTDNHRPAYFYLCGWKAMIDEAKMKIVALGYDKKDIHLELYG